MTELKNEREQEEAIEFVDDVVHVSSDYLSAGCKMVALQIAHAPAEDRPKTREEFHTRCTELMRQHVPLMYAFFFEQSKGQNIVPTGTVDIILEYVWAEPNCAKYLGGKNSGIILPGQN